MRPVTCDGAQRIDRSGSNLLHLILMSKYYCEQIFVQIKLAVLAPQETVLVGTFIWDAVQKIGLFDPNFSQQLRMLK